MVEKKVKYCLGEISHLMREAGLWTNETPAKQALESRAPFCCDTLTFEAWLQFIFLPKMTHIIEQELPLPARSDIAPMAEQRFDTSDPVIVRLIDEIRELDLILQGEHRH